MIEGSGSIPLTNGSRSRRLKNLWIWWIRIRNTDNNEVTCAVFTFSSLVKPAAEIAVKTGLVNICTLHKQDQSNLPTNWKPLTYSLWENTHSGRSVQGRLELYLGKQRVMRKAMRLKADKERNIPVQPPTTSKEWLKSTLKK
jgi:hypothetical protein